MRDAKMTYAELHCHSYYSLLDGASAAIGDGELESSPHRKQRPGRATDATGPTLVFGRPSISSFPIPTAV